MAKKSMIEHEKKRIKLHNKYALKRANLLKRYQDADSFTMKLEIHSKIQKYLFKKSVIKYFLCWE